jgi:hypothetical protein
MKHTWLADGGHEWLAVPITMAREVEGISEYSYIDPNGKVAYLEGDCDAARFIAHHKLTEMDMTVGKYYDGDAPLRNYARYK